MKPAIFDQFLPSRRFAAIAGTLATLAWPSLSFAIPIMQGEVTNLMAAQETATESLKFIAGQEHFDPGTSFTTTGQFAANSWSYNISGSSRGHVLSLQFGGSLTGNFGSDITVSFTGTGSYGATPFSSSGQLVLVFDTGQNDYFIANYDDAMTYGSGTVSKTVRGAELIGGIGIGAYFGGWWGAFVGASGAWFLSDVVDAFLPGPNPPPPPARPAPPASPPQTMPPAPPPINNNGEFAGAVFAPGANVTINKNNGNRIYGAGTLDTSTGQYVGSTSVPEPSILWLIAGGLGILGLMSRRRHRQSMPLAG